MIEIVGLKGHKKPRKYLKVCRFCGIAFCAADVKAYTCSDCAIAKIPCKGNCGRVVTKAYVPTVQPVGYCRVCRARSRWATLLSKGFVSPLKGRNYADIFKGKTTANGFQKGARNVAKQTDVKMKISSAIKQSYTPALRDQRRVQIRDRMIAHGVVFGKKCCFDSTGSRFRSKLEARFSDLLKANRIEYEYEHRVRLCDGGVKVVDFYIPPIMVEISGFAYENWKKDFSGKMGKLRNTVANPILVLTYPECVQEASERIGCCAVMSVHDEQGILRYIESERSSYVHNS